MSEETVFEEALSRSPEERPAFLERACEGRRELRAAVEALLAAYEKSGNILDLPPAPAADSEPGSPGDDATRDRTSGPGDGSPAPTATADYRPASEAGSVIAGRYTLQERVGEGGMGEVWVARQTEPVKRKVALKLIKAGMDSRAVLQRFDQERQALAIMEHPNIARVIDGGMTAERRPFFVMELVNGLPLTRFCDEARLGIRERLELFVAICQAVQHAHQKGIIHRDLKPSNILVTIIDGIPVPKVIDFGVAKAITGRLTDESLSTQFGAVVGTLEYMSPEQAGFSGEDIDTRADIYSLGVILYELLTGLRPIDATRLKKAALTEMLRIIKEEDPSKPSTRLSTDESAPSMAALRHTEPRKLAAMLRGEMDWVVMKCLEKRRDRRYETANGLARDIQRYLADEVVEARPPSAGYRVRKLVSRHRGQALAAGLLLLAMLAGMAGTTWGLIREAKANADLTRSRAAVQARYDLAVDAIKTFHTGVSGDFLLKQGQFKALRDRLLKSAAEFYGKLGALLGKETDLTSRRALAAANFELAVLTGTVGRHEDALAAQRAVLAAREALAAEPGADAALKTDVGRSLYAVADLLNGMGKKDEALATHRRSESLLAGLARAEPSARATLAACRSMMGWALFEAGNTADALTAYKLARADQEALAAAPGASDGARNDLAGTVNRIGVLLLATSKPVEAEAEFRTALAIHQKLTDDNPAAAEFRHALAHSHNDLGILLTRTGQLPEAEAQHRQALAIQKKLADDNPAVTTFQHKLAFDHNSLGNLLSDMGRPAEAEAEYRRALAIQKKLVEDNPAVTAFQDDLAKSHGNLGTLLWTDKPSEAEAEYCRALAIQEKLAEDNPAVTDFQLALAFSHHKLGALLSATSRPSEAEAEYRRALAIHEKLVEDNPAVAAFRRNLATSHSRMGTIQRSKGQTSEAVASFRRTVAVMERLPTPNAHDLYNVACCHAALAGAAADPGSGVPAAECRAEADRAMDILRRAITGGFRQLAHMQTDTDLDPLRAREDFQLLMMDLAFPADPFLR